MTVIEPRNGDGDGREAGTVAGREDSMGTGSEVGTVAGREVGRADSTVAGRDAGTVAALEAVGLTKHFPVRRLHWKRSVVRAVDDVSLRLDPGTVTAVVGESGSGKSTVTRLLARLITPTSGQIKLAGQAVTGSADHTYRRRVQLVLQDPFSSLNPVHSVRYHLYRPLQLHGMADGDLAGSAGRLLERVALGPAGQFLDKYPHELSGGQRQRVAIARALAVRPEVLLADEPVSMLDVSIRLGVLNLLADLRDAEGLALLYVTHDIGSARYLADTVMVMYAGQVVEAGPAATVTDEPAHPYAQLLRGAVPDPRRAQITVGTIGRSNGGPPSLVHPPSGCRFHPRCPHVMAVCRTSAPPSVPVTAGHTAACWLHVEGRPRS